MLKLIGADWQPVFVDFFASGVQRKTVELIFGHPNPSETKGR
jgi:hypothetical protein